MLGILKRLHEVAGHTKHVLCKAARLIPNDVGLLIQLNELQADQGAAPVRGSVSSGWVEDDGPRNAGAWKYIWVLRCFLFFLLQEGNVNNSTSETISPVKEAQHDSGL